MLEKTLYYGFFNHIHFKQVIVYG